MRLLRRFVVGFCCLALAACADNGGSGGSAVKIAAAPAAQFVTYNDQFAELQASGLRGDYAQFARALKAPDPAPVIADLRRSFGGQPFDVYTRRATVNDQTARRAVELRSTTGRLYLFVEMTRVPGGWIVKDYTLSRKRDAVMTRL
ncbi:MAG: hypothetical protein AAGD13_20505 [Pseudomonadota bacterium]